MLLKTEELLEAARSLPYAAFRFLRCPNQHEFLASIPAAMKKSQTGLWIEEDWAQ
jgi:translation initiation factor IF-1